MSTEPAGDQRERLVARILDGERKLTPLIGTGDPRFRPSLKKWRDLLGEYERLCLLAGRG